MLRTHTCGELRAEHIGQEVTLCGWVDSYRDHGGGMFLDLRDRYGKTQIVVGPETNAEIQTLARTLRSEFVISVTGAVAHRPEGTVNAKLPTGEIEVRPTKMLLLNKSVTPPFQPGILDIPNEDLRLKYRYLDLRRQEMQATMVLRHRITMAMRHFFDEQGFIDIETPMLGRSTPEGARDYLVPSRVHQGEFYALPQSPQLYKQILMIAGYDRYVQVARCFRDEDLRADRQPEFTQLDLEMSFVDADDIINLIDGLVAVLAKDIFGQDVQLPLPRMTYDEAMERFGHDAPDLRFGMELVDLTDLAAEAEFRVFHETAASGGHVRGINAVGAASKYSRKGIDELTNFVVQDFGAKGLAWFKVEEGGTLASPIAKNFSPALLEKIGARMQAKSGDLLLFVADKYEVTCKALYALRKRFGEELKLYDPAAMSFSWVVEFPMFAWDDEENAWAAMHHPFTAPRPRDLPLLASDPGKCRASLRPDHQRFRGRWRHDPNPRSANPTASVHAAGHFARTSARAVRVSAGCLGLRCSAARRHRAGIGSLRHALRRARQHSRLHRVPQNAEGHGSYDRCAQLRFAQTIARAGTASTTRGVARWPLTSASVVATIAR